MERNESVVQRVKAQSRTQRWKELHTTKITVRFNNEKDSDVIAKLSSVGNKPEYLRKLIREDIQKNNA